MAKRDGTKVITNKVRLSYPNLFEPREQESGDKKYGASLIISKDDTETIKLLEEATQEAANEGKSKFKNGKVPANLKTPLRDGDVDREDDPAYENCYFINANSTRKPQCVDQRMKKIEDPEDLYPGCYVRASVNFFAFNSNGNQGVGVGLNNIQKMGEGEPLAGGSSAEEDFEAVEVTEDDVAGEDDDLI